jgi:hypothetical protein
MRNEYYDGIIKIIDEVMPRAPDEVKVPLTVCRSLVKDLKDLNNELDDRTTLLDERDQKQQETLKVTQDVFVHLITILAKKVNALESIKQDVDKIKVQQEKLEPIRASYEQRVNKRTKEIQQQMKQNQEDIKKQLPGVS